MEICRKSQIPIVTCLPSLLRFIFEGKLGLGPGMATRFAKAPAGISAFLGETKGFPQREAEGLKPRLFPWKNHRLVVSQSAALSPGPCRGFEV